MSTRYIQRKDAHGLETVDEVTCETHAELRAEVYRLLDNYRMCDPSATYYASKRPCKAWKEKG